MERPAIPAGGDLGVGGARPGEHDVVAKRADEDVVLLGDQHDVLAELVRGQVGDRDAAHAKT